jgi:hypothetical protein
LYCAKRDDEGVASARSTLSTGVNEAECVDHQIIAVLAFSNAPAMRLASAMSVAGSG